MSAEDRTVRSGQTGLMMLQAYGEMVRNGGDADQGGVPREAVMFACP